MSEIDAPSPALAAIDACGVVAILRGPFLDQIEAIVARIVGGGVRALEISLTSPRAFEQIERAAIVAAAGVSIGAGTVMTAADVAEAAKRGAGFIVAPVVDGEVIRAALDLGITPIPGAATPTEIVQALKAGAPAVKLFPAETLGPDFIRAVRAPFPAVRLVPTGGVTLSRAEQFSAAGAWAVGVGTPLISAPPELDSLSSRAAAFVRAMRPPAG